MSNQRLTNHYLNIGVNGRLTNHLPTSSYQPLVTSHLRQPNRWWEALASRLEAMAPPPPRPPRLRLRPPQRCAPPCRPCRRACGCRRRRWGSKQMKLSETLMDSWCLISLCWFVGWWTTGLHFFLEPGCCCGCWQGFEFFGVPRWNPGGALLVNQSAWKESSSVAAKVGWKVPGGIQSAWHFRISPYKLWESNLILFHSGYKPIDCATHGFELASSLPFCSQPHNLVLSVKWVKWTAIYWG